MSERGWVNVSSWWEGWREEVWGWREEEEEEREAHAPGLELTNTE